MTNTEAKPRLLVIIGSVRDGRIGKTVGDWFAEKAQEHGGFDVTVADLRELDLPLMTEPNHPAGKKYTQEKTWEWSRMVEAADALVFVTPEYNHGTTAPIINALDYLNNEWKYKVAGIVSYAGFSGGIRAVQELKLRLVGLSMMPIFEGVMIPNVGSVFNKETGEVTASQIVLDSVTMMLDAMLKWDSALRQLREPAS